MLFTSGFIYVFVNNGLRAMKIKMVKKLGCKALTFTHMIYVIKLYVEILLIKMVERVEIDFGNQNSSCVST